MDTGRVELPGNRVRAIWRLPFHVWKRSYCEICMTLNVGIPLKKKVNGIDCCVNCLYYMQLCFSADVIAIITIMGDQASSFIKPVTISAVICPSIMTKALVIFVIARYAELREDRSTLFMLSLSVSDLATGCISMPISAAVCSNATSSVRHINKYLPEVQMFCMWCFSFNSLHGLCWLNLYKMIALLKPLHHEQLFTTNRCYSIIVTNWIVGAGMAASKFGQGASWNMISCTFFLVKSAAFSVVSLVTYAFVAIVPAAVLVYATARIFIVVARTQRAISTQIHTVDHNYTGSEGLVTLQALRSANNVLIICLVPALFTIPLLAAAILHHSMDNVILVVES